MTRTLTLTALLLTGLTGLWWSATYGPPWLALPATTAIALATTATALWWPPAHPDDPPLVTVWENGNGTRRYQPQLPDGRRLYTRTTNVVTDEWAHPNRIRPEYEPYRCRTRWFATFIARHQLRHERKHHWKETS